MYSLACPNGVHNREVHCIGYHVPESLNWFGSVINLIVHNPALSEHSVAILVVELTSHADGNIDTSWTAPSITV